MAHTCVHVCTYRHLGDGVNGGGMGVFNVSMKGFLGHAKKCPPMDPLGYAEKIWV